MVDCVTGNKKKKKKHFKKTVGVKGGTVKLSGYLGTYAPTAVPEDKTASQ